MFVCASQSDLMKVIHNEIHLRPTTENQASAMKQLTIVIPLSLAVILILLYLQFQSILTSIIIFAGVFVAWGGGFMLIWLMATRLQQSIDKHKATTIDGTL